MGRDTRIGRRVGVDLGVIGAREDRVVLLVDGVMMPNPRLLPDLVVVEVEVISLALLNPQVVSEEAAPKEEEDTKVVLQTQEEEDTGVVQTQKEEDIEEVVRRIPTLRVETQLGHHQTQAMVLPPAINLGQDITLIPLKPLPLRLNRVTTNLDIKL